ncbi:MAG: hypothetical protein LBU77_02990 [Clostridiales bacterium]|jgi:hypothetical protein|nr:hypothetical protein [Clostridiales bacterium]
MGLFDSIKGLATGEKQADPARTEDGKKPKTPDISPKEPLEQPAPAEELLQEEEMAEGDETDPGKLAAFYAAAEKLANANDPETISKLNTIDSLNKNIDDELDALIEKDQSALPPEEEHKGMINDVAVYEEGRVELVPLHLPGIGEQKTKEVIARVNAMPIKVFAAIFAALLITIAGSGLFLIATIKSMNDAKNNPVTPDSAAAEPSKALSNGMNYIYIKQSKPIGGQEVELTKMVADSAATVFYFDQPLDTSAYYITLSDNNSDIYTLEPTENDEEKDAVVRFSPLNEGVAGVSLAVSAVDGGETVIYDYELATPVTYAPARYLGEPIDLALGEGMGAKIYGAAFSSIGSSVYFGFTPNSRGETAIIRQSADKTGLQLNEAARTLRPAQSFPTLYTFGEQVLGRMDFAPVRNLNGTVTLTFDGLFKEMPLSRTVKSAGLFSNTAAAEQRIDAGGHEIVLERMGIFDDKCLLVLHAEQKTLNPETGLPQRTEVQLDTALVIEKADGSSVTIPGTAGSVPEGTDIVYDIGEVKDEIKNVPYSNFSIHIKNVQLKLDDVHMEIALGSADSALSAQNTAARDSVRTAMAQRLLYKSGKLSADALTGFSPAVLQNADVMANYTPIDGISDARYATQVIACAEEGDQMNIVVAETWRGQAQEKELNFSRTHKITANRTENGWIITGDVLI